MTRRFDLDWIRVAAFALLVLYHVGMFYVPWEWHVKSPRQSEGLTVLMFFTNPWRLPLLFLVSGSAIRFLFDKAPGWPFLRSRTVRLLPPLLFGMFVIVPPQTYYEVLSQAPELLHGWSDFWRRYATGSGNWCRGDECLITPTWNHLWFVAYLFVYSVLIAALTPWLRTLRLAPGRVSAWLLLGAPAVYLIAVRLIVFPRFEITHGLVDDVAMHAMALPVFLFGFFTAKSEAVRDTLTRARWIALTLWMVGYACFAAYAWVYRAEADIPPPELIQAARVAFALQQWMAICAILGFGARHLNRDSQALRYLTEAVFPVYIVHQTITVVGGYYLAQLQLPLVVEAGLLVVGTYGVSFAVFEVVRRVAVLRPLFGLRLVGRSGS